MWEDSDGKLDRSYLAVTLLHRRLCLFYRVWPYCIFMQSSSTSQKKIGLDLTG